MTGDKEREVRLREVRRNAVIWWLMPCAWRRK